MTVVALIPIYLLVALGFTLVRTGYVPKDTIRPANQFVIDVFVPVLIFLIVFRMAGEGGIDWEFVLGYGAASIAAMLATMLALRTVFAYTASKSALLSLAASGSNAIFIGYPLLLALYAGIADLALSWVLIVENLFLIGLAVLLQDLLAEGGRTRRSAVLGLAKQPILIALVSGLVLPLLVGTLWGPLETALDMMRQATVGISLVLIGGMLARSRFGGNLPAILTVAAAKLVLHPLLVVAVFTALGISGEFFIAAVVFASISCFGFYANFCERAGEGEFGASVFTVTTLLAPVSVAFWLAIANLL